MWVVGSPIQAFHAILLMLDCYDLELFSFVSDPNNLALLGGLDISSIHSQVHAKS
jgi:hypothetical protein